MPGETIEQLLDHQAYRLCFWKVAADEINYRRFFDINDLAALRMELPRVFEDVHRKVMDLLACGKLAGLRIDHPDGLLDPKQYFQRLQSRYIEACAKLEYDADPQFRQVPWNEARHAVQERLAASSGQPLFVLVEKILAPDEPLRNDWPVAGTSGYDFISIVNGLFIDPSAEPILTRGYHDLTGDPRTFQQLAHRNKRLILKCLIGARSDHARQAPRPPRPVRPQCRDFTFPQLSCACAS